MGGNEARTQMSQVRQHHAKMLSTTLHQGRRPRGELGETVPPKFEVGDGPIIRPSNILRSSVVGCARKYEQSKKKVSYEGIPFWNSDLSCKERVIYDIYLSKDTENLEKERENQKSLADD